MVYPSQAILGGSSTSDIVIDSDGTATHSRNSTISETTTTISNPQVSNSQLDSSSPPSNSTAASLHAGAASGVRRTDGDTTGAHGNNIVEPSKAVENAGVENSRSTTPCLSNTDIASDAITDGDLSSTSNIITTRAASPNDNTTTTTKAIASTTTLTTESQAITLSTNAQSPSAETDKTTTIRNEIGGQYHTEKNPRHSLTLVL